MRHLLFFFAVCATLPAGIDRSIPFSFEKNLGQARSDVQFLARTGQYAVLLNHRGAVFTSDGSTVLAMKLAGANRLSRIEGVGEAPARSNYYIGNDPSRWRAGIPSYSRVRYRSVYPGIDLIFYGNQRELEYDLVVAPGADPRAIRLVFEGARKISVDARGDLLLETAAGELRQHKPRIYQEISGARRTVQGGYILQARHRVGFEVGQYDRRQPLIIDPVLSYSTYLGGAGDDRGNDIAVDAGGNVFVVGQTQSANFPAVPASPQNALHAGGSDVFVAKLNPTGGLVYSTYIGGTSVDAGFGISVDSTGAAYITGGTFSNDFPTTTGAFQPSKHAGEDAFVTKLNASGAIVYSTYLGGSITGISQLGDEGAHVAVDGAGNAYVAGSTFSADFPVTTGALQTAFGGLGDGFVTKLNPTGTALVYSTFLGGTRLDGATDIAVDTAGNAYVTGYAGSNDFPVTQGAFQTARGGGPLFGDAFILKINPAGNRLVYSTFLGGTSDEIAIGIAVDSAGNAYATGTTVSLNFPTTPGAFQTNYVGGDTDVWVSKLDPTGARLLYSTYLGGNGADDVSKIALDATGSAYIAGTTDSTNFRITSGAYQASKSDGADAFLVKFSPGGDAVLYGTYLGGNGTDVGNGVDIDGAGNVYIVGTTSSTSFPSTPGAFQTANKGSNDAFIVKLDLVAGSPARISAESGDRQSGKIGTVLANPLVVQVQDTRGNAVAGVAVTFSATKATANPTTATTDSAGKASTRVTLGDTAGAATITATVAGVGSVTFTATIEGAGVQIVIDGVVDAGGFSAKGAPGGILTIFGSNFTDTTLQASTVPLPLSLGGVSVTVNGRAAPLFYVSPRQINFQMPFGISPGTAAVVVNSGANSSTTFSLTTAAVAPGIFQFGDNRAVAQNQDYSLNNTGNPAKIGSFVTVYMTGQGEVDQPVPAGGLSPADPPAHPVLRSSATIGGENADILFIGLTPGGIGLLQVNLRVPNLRSGDHAVVVTIGEVPSNAAKITVSEN